MGGANVCTYVISVMGVVPKLSCQHFVIEVRVKASVQEQTVADPGGFVGSAVSVL